MRRALRAVLAVALLALPPLSAPAAADWLVTEDGERMETTGPWEVRGPLVVFRLAADGSLASLRADAVDLEASRAATAEALKPPPEVAAEPVEEREPVLVLTDEDVGHVAPEGVAGSDATGPAGEGRGEPEDNGTPDREEPGDGAEPAAGGDTEPGGGPLGVSSWRLLTAPDGEGVEVFGRIANDGAATARSLEIEVELRAADGSLLTSAPAEISPRRLPPGETANFRASFPGLVEPAEVTFRVRAQGLGGPPG